MAKVPGGGVRAFVRRKMTQCSCFFAVCEDDICVVAYDFPAEKEKGLRACLVRIFEKQGE